MKKTERRPLHLDRTTLRTLTGAELSGRVAGGLSLGPMISANGCSGKCNPCNATLISACGPPDLQ
jgi:hypothetical protein